MFDEVGHKLYDMSEIASKISDSMTRGIATSTRRPKNRRTCRNTGRMEYDTQMSSTITSMSPTLKPLDQPASASMTAMREYDISAITRGGRVKHISNQH